MDKSPHKSAFVVINGVRLHYLDWGGHGDTLIFLTGLGDSAHVFDQIAPRFTDKFRVLALTRRGQGESDNPNEGYSLDILIDDIYKFMNLLSIERAILVGHSFAGSELTFFAEKYPDKVLKLIYLDAVYDRKGKQEVMKNYPLSDIQPPDAKTEFDTLEDYVNYIKGTRPDLAVMWNQTWTQVSAYDLTETSNSKYKEKDLTKIQNQLLEGVKDFEPKSGMIKVPVLSFVVISSSLGEFPNYFTEEQKQLELKFIQKYWLPFLQGEITRFKNDIPHAKIIEVPDGHHYCYIVQEQLVYDKMREFLLE
ncbi:MAG: alpha/beta hydrolase [Anaerolineales bacterium]|nr:alpha/beta hydrolase [Anaerolineales bacterium]